MPLYTYRCDTCSIEDTISHGRDEDLSGCECVKNLTLPEGSGDRCVGSMKKLLSAVPHKFVNPGDKTQVVHHD